MMRILKYGFILTLLAVGGLLVAPFVIDVNDYRDEISRQVEQATGRRFTIGEIHASFVPWIGLELRDVRMANATGFSHPDFLRAKSLQIQVEVMPLLNRQIVIRTFRLIEPQIFLERNARGEGNWQDLTGSTPTSGGAPAPATPEKRGATTHSTPAGGGGILQTLAAQSIILDRGHIGWRNGDNTGIDINNIQLAIHDLQQERPVAIELSASVGGSGIRIEAHVGPLGDLAALDATRLPLQLRLQADNLALNAFRSLTGALPDTLGDDPALSTKLQLEQRPDGTRVTAGRLTLNNGGGAPFRGLDLDWQAEINRNNNLQLRTTTLTVDGQRLLRGNGTVTNLDNKPRFQLRLQSELLTRAWLAHYIPALSTLYAAHPDPWENLQVGALLRGDQGRIAFEDLQILLNGESLQGEGGWRSGKAPAIRLSLSGRTLHLDPWLPMPKEEAPAARPKSATTPPPGARIDAPAPAPTNSTEPDLRPFAHWRIDLHLAIDTLTAHKLALQHLQVAVQGEKGRYRLDPLRFGLAGGQVTEKATFDINRYPLRWTESLQLSGVHVLPVLQALADTDILDGTVEMKTSLRGSGMVSNRAAERLNGTGKLTVRNGRIKGFDIAGTLRNLTTFSKQKGPKQTDFSTLSGSFRIVNGVLDNRDLFMASPLFRLTGFGTVNLAAKTLDYHAKPKLVGTLIGQGDTLPVRKGLAIPVRITGSFDAPRIVPEIDPMTLINNVGGLLKRGAGGVGSLIKDAGQGAGKLIEGVTGGVGAGLGGAIGTLLGGGKTTAPAPRGGATIQPKGQPARIAPATPRAPSGGALIAPPPTQRKPAPPTQQQQLQKAIGNLLNNL